MVTMSATWERTTAVLAGRGGMLAGIAIPTLYVPTVLRAAQLAYGTPGATGYAALGMVLALAVMLLSIWGQLALIAVSSDPAVLPPEARTRATRRLLPALGISIALVVALGLLCLPILLPLVAAGYDFTVAGPQPIDMAPGVAMGVGLYGIVLGIALLFVGARLTPLYAVVLAERRGLGAILRSVRLTRRHTWRLVGAILLFLIVLTIATWATQAVAGLAFRLLLGAEATATVAFLTAIVTAAVSTVFSVIAVVFTAQLYVALAAREARQEPAAA